MLKRWLRCLPAGFVLAAIVLAILWFVQPLDFSKIAPADSATEFYIYTTDAGASHELQDARPEKDTMAPLLELLNAGTVRLDGRSRSIQWASEDTLYHLSFYPDESGVWVRDADFALCTDGMLYVPHDWLGYIRYRLTNCDITAVDAELRQILGIA